MRNNNGLFIIGLVLLIAGAAVLVYGIIQYSNVTKALIPSVMKSIAGSSDEEKQAVTLMIVGGAGALLGFFLLVVSRRRR
jgi:LPXTG-motif cell wall-anchored protein